jgi:hypothetical protein
MTIKVVSFFVRDKSSDFVSVVCFRSEAVAAGASRSSLSARKIRPTRIRHPHPRPHPNPSHPTMIVKYRTFPAANPKPRDIFIIFVFII